MRFVAAVSLFVAVILSGVGASGKRIDIVIDFPINSHQIERDFSDNARQLARLDSLLGSGRDTTVSIDTVWVRAYASPDGRLDSNRRLSLRRMVSMRDYLVDTLGLDSEKIYGMESAVPWETFRGMIAERPFEGSDKVLEIISEGNDDNITDNTRRMNRLKRLEGGKVWSILSRDYFPELRSACTLVVCTSHPVAAPPAIEEPAEATSTEHMAAPTEEEVVEEPTEPEPRCYGGWHLRTSALGWASAVANISGEYDFSCHWSVGLSADYSGWNYGKETRKYRVLKLRPEVRCYPMSGHRGFFVEAHAAMMYYNVALPSWEYRIQDRGGRRPALGGGVGVGYRLPLGRGGRWSVEAAVGAGAYHLDYDRFENRANGLLVDSHKRFFFGIDNVALSIVYTINPYPSRKK